jgi:DNA-binding transcriptional regulator of glucitol operon
VSGATEKSVWLTPRALRLHVVILVVVPGFMALCLWQLDRALNGNELSWAYVFEWPFFAAYAVYMWWRFVHELPETTAVTEVAASETVPPEPNQTPDRVEAETKAADAELAAYNEYLAELAARDKAAGR